MPARTLPSTRPARTAGSGGLLHRLH
jgi:hypothetical protein